MDYESEGLIWRPCYLGVGTGFDISLDRRFANKMIMSKMYSETAKKMNDIAKNSLKNFCLNPYYLFYQDTSLINQIVLDGTNGVYLVLEKSSICDLCNPVKYKTHNVENSKDAHGLLVLFDLWVSHSIALRNSNTKSLEKNIANVVS